MNSSRRPPVEIGAPLTAFPQYHEGILASLRRIRELSGLLEPAARARKAAKDVIAFFAQIAYQHHAEEEKELFPAVLSSAQDGDESERVRNMVTQLTQEHREIESLWARLEPQLERVVKGQDSELDATEIDLLTRMYEEHAAFEEREFLPLSEIILGRNSNHMKALGISLHLRHQPRVVGRV